MHPESPIYGLPELFCKKCSKNEDLARTSHARQRAETPPRRTSAVQCPAFRCCSTSKFPLLRPIPQCIQGRPDWQSVPARYFNSAINHARLKLQSRLTDFADTFKISAVSSAVNPPKKRSSTTLALRGSRRASASSASSRRIN